MLDREYFSKNLFIKINIAGLILGILLFGFGEIKHRMDSYNCNNNYREAYNDCMNSGKYINSNGKSYASMECPLQTFVTGEDCLNIKNVLAELSYFLSIIFIFLNILAFFICFIIYFWLLLYRKDKIKAGNCFRKYIVPIILVIILFVILNYVCFEIGDARGFSPRDLKDFFNNFVK